PVSRFFFQAEDGIRDLTVTGVQTCALPILFFVFCLVQPATHSFAQSTLGSPVSAVQASPAQTSTSKLGSPQPAPFGPDEEISARSEERRVGKECRSRRAAHASKRTVVLS